MKIIKTWSITLLCFCIGAWPIGLIGLFVSLYISIKELSTRQNTEDAAELAHQREIEQKEINMVRKSNEILLHLIQEEHREKEDR